MYSDLDPDCQEMKKKIDLAMVQVIQNINEQTCVIQEALKNKEQKAQNTPLQIEQRKSVLQAEISKLHLEKDQQDGQKAKELENEIEKLTKKYTEESKNLNNLTFQPSIQQGIDIENLGQQLKDLEDAIVKDLDDVFDDLIEDINNMDSQAQ